MYTALDSSVSTFIIILLLTVNPHWHFIPSAHATIAEYMGKEGCNVNIPVTTRHSLASCVLHKEVPLCKHILTVS
jgi:hypothetical protein